MLNWGPFKYQVIKIVGGWVWPNAYVIKKFPENIKNDENFINPYPKSYIIFCFLLFFKLSRRNFFNQINFKRNFIFLKVHIIKSEKKF